MNTDNNIVDNKDDCIDDKTLDYDNSIYDINRLININDRIVLSNMRKRFKYSFDDKLYNKNK